MLGRFAPRLSLLIALALGIGAGPETKPVDVPKSPDPIKTPAVRPFFPPGRPAIANPTASKPVDSKAMDAKPADLKPVDPKAADPKPADPKAAAMKAADKPATETPPKPAPPPVPERNISTASPTPAAAATEADKLLAEEILKGAKQSPVGRCDDATFLRRVTLDITGQIPTPQEQTKFSLDPSPEKRAKAVERLLSSSDFGRNWAHYWRDVIMSRKTEDRAQIVAASCQDYLSERFNKNMAWDQIARDFITATGDVREAGNTAIFMAQNANAEDVTSEISRIFMGIQISCANCHNHPTDHWVREQFHSLAAFFPRVEVRQMMGDVRTFTVQGVNRDALFRGGNQRRASNEHYMQDLKRPTDRGKLMQPVFFVTGQKLSTGVSDEERRTTIAKWITAPSDEWFGKAYVNRLWSELVGEGFYEPVDDIGPDRQCAAPKTLDYLAKEFVAHGHDIKWLFESIMATEAYQRESRSRRSPEDTPFTASVEQRLRADQLYDSLTKALGMSGGFGGGFGGGGGGGFRGRGNQFSTVFNYDPSVRRDEITGSIPQALMMMNSFEFSRYISGRSPATALGRLLSQTKDDEAVTIDLYLRCLAREPKDSEVKQCLAYVKKVGSRTEAFEDILWALVNSTEFLHRK